MNRPSSGSILLLGEGDFSLSVALNKQLPTTHMVSTALLDQSSINIHKKAQENITILQSAGVIVHLGVDATRLKEDERIGKQQFSRIVFNFPHIGGKSNIKQNRELLQKFFQSAVECLTDDGDICVSLCRGQGGTPADIPMRQWSDSWQVVAMAAYSDQVLSDTVPFIAKDFPEYSCTGFRSRDQYFHTEGAVTHVFKRITPSQLPNDTIIYGTVKVDDKVYYTNEYVEQVVSNMRTTLSLEQHPVNVARRLFESAIREIDPDVSIENVLKLPYVIEENIQKDQIHYLLHTAKPCEIADHFYQDSKRKEVNVATSDPSNHLYLAPCENSSQSIGCQVCTATEGVHKRHVCPIYNRNSFQNGKTVHLLRASLLESMIQTNCFKNRTETCMFLAGGDTYQRCTISPNKTPQHYEMVCWQRNVDVEYFQDVIKKSLESVLGKQNVCCEKVEQQNKKRMACEQYDETVLSHVNVELILYTDVKTENPLTVPCNFAYDLQENDRQLNASLSRNNATQVGKKKCQLKNPAITKIPFAYIGSLKTDPTIQVCVCTVDLVCRILFGISDARLLWSNCPTVLAQLSGQQSQTASPVLPPSLYAPKWKHDISFWQDPLMEFDELTYMDVVRDHLGDCVKEVILMNVWTPDGEERTSRCYRQLHQPSDQAVSYHRAHEFQRLLRLKVAHVFKIELR